jgi:hypothetical protein
MSDGNRNTYLDQVMAQQERLESDLRSKRAATPAPQMAAAMYEPASSPGAPPAPQAEGLAGSAAGPSRSPHAHFSPDQAAAHNGVEVRITGVGRWKTVLVPPNAFVVHTRRGKAEPLHVGLGVSFRYNPQTDAFLAVPGAMQTILLNAFCICRELQGILVQAYVQWIIHDFSTAYRKLDFSDPAEPMRLVNLQLKEQAEAAIKDKVATMSVHEVLSDRQPIIEELTARLRAVAEGEGAGGSGEGLGLRIVTVQIKEAVVSSARLWENLQKPFRAEQGRLAALAELAADGAVTESRMAETRRQETRRLADERDLAELRSGNEAAAFDRETAEQARRERQAQENQREAADARNQTHLHALNLERERHEQDSEMARLRIRQEQELNQLRLDAELATARARVQVDHERAMLELERAQARAEIENARSAASLQAELISALPQIAERLPAPAEYKAVNLTGRDPASLAGLVAELTAVVQALKPSP